MVNAVRIAIDMFAKRLGSESLLTCCVPAVGNCRPLVYESTLFLGGQILPDRLDAHALLSNRS